MTRIAIVGSGIAGMACGHFLNDRFDITLFERNNYIGGHSNTVEVPENGTKVPIDTGFMVFNELTYPLLTRLLKKLDVGLKQTTMSFSLQHRPLDIEWCGNSLQQVFGQRKNIFSPRFWKFVSALARYNKIADADADLPQVIDLSLQEYADWRGLSKDLMNLYLIPMASAIWSTPPSAMQKFPAATLLRFFKNHKFNSGLEGHLEWCTIAGGAKEYVRKLTQPFQSKIKLDSQIVKIIRKPDSVDLISANGETYTFDTVILASHADESLRMLENPSAEESKILSLFQYSKNTATLHQDASVMPKTKGCWASWNFRYDDSNSSTHYWMNSLQGVSEETNYFVSINGEELIDPKSIHRTILYDHPTFSSETFHAQSNLRQLNKLSAGGNILFCGSYFGYGFHEDALASALDVCRLLAGDSIWN
jgi:predicted NAD/FAD-binding protein